MLKHSLHMLLCFSLLACPAVGGQCCGATVETATFEQDSNEQPCGHCCCEKAKPGDRSPVPEDCPDQCHDCICAGALPAGFQALKISARSDWGIRTASHDACVVMRIAPLGDLPDRNKPPSGRTLLASICVLLL
mgnify:FL=1